jgi:hypothetical protein
LAPFLCKTLLLPLGIVGLAATRVKIEEGARALSIEKLQNIDKHDFFHLEDRVGDERDSTLDQVGMKMGSELDPGNFCIFILLG